MCPLFLSKNLVQFSSVFLISFSILPLGNALFFSLSLYLSVHSLISKLFAIIMFLITFLCSRLYSVHIVFHTLKWLSALQSPQSINILFSFRCISFESIQFICHKHDSMLLLPLFYQQISVLAFHFSCLLLFFAFSFYFGNGIDLFDCTMLCSIALQ